MRATARQGPNPGAQLNEYFFDFMVKRSVAVELRTHTGQKYLLLGRGEMVRKHVEVVWHFILIEVAPLQQPLTPAPAHVGEELEEPPVLEECFPRGYPIAEGADVPVEVAYPQQTTLPL